MAGPGPVALRRAAAEDAARCRALAQRAYAAYLERMLTHAERRARDLGLTRVRLYTNVVMTENQRLYTRIGYVETGRDHADRWSRVHYAKQLGTE